MDTYRIAVLKELPSKARVGINATVISIKEVAIKTGELMAFCTARDASGNVHLVVFSDVYAKYANIIALDDPLIITGTLEKADSLTIMVESVSTTATLPQNSAPC